jgi:MYXO-CTERM domain-containing protein
LAFCAAAVAALAIGPFIYRSMLPAAAGAPPASCSFVVVTGGLFALLVAAAIWLLRRRRRSREPDLDRRLREAVLGEGEKAPPRDDDR